jgi:hypothetical protein
MKYVIIMYLLMACTPQSKESKVLPTPVIPATTVVVGDSLMQFNNGFWLYNNQPFSGTLVNYGPNKTIAAQQTFFNGKEQGWGVTFYSDGAIESKRYYTKGEKDSVHYGWWYNGNKRFEYHFKQGNYHGDFKEWYETGEPFKYIIYDNGTERKGLAWRRNGKLYLNYVMQNGRRYGLINSGLCYSLKDERGEYIKSVKEDSAIAK